MSLLVTAASIRNLPQALRDSTTFGFTTTVVSAKNRNSA